MSFWLDSSDDECLIASEEEEDDDSSEAAEAWGAAVRARLSAPTEGTALEARGCSVLSGCAQDDDILMALMEQRTDELTDACGVVTEQRMRDFTRVARVCKAWRDAVNYVTSRRHLLCHAGCPFTGLTLPSFAYAYTNVASRGVVMVAANHQLHLVNVNDGRRRTLGRSGALPGEFWYPHGIAATDTALYVADRSNHRIQKLLHDGTPVLIGEQVPPALSAVALAAASLRTGEDMAERAVEEHGATVAETNGGTSERPAASLARSGAGAGLWGPYGLAVGESEAGTRLLFASDSNHNRIVAFDAERLRFQFTFSGGGDAQLDRPRGLAFHDGEVFVADFGRGRVAVFRASGEFTR